jgi:hypothetical protein
MKCVKCGNISSEASRFCSRCGSPLVPADAGAGSAPPAGSAAAGASALTMENVPPRAAGDSYGARATAGSVPPSPLLERVKNILLSPRSEWERVAAEPGSIGGLFTGYVLPLLAAMALISFIHLSVIGSSTFLGGSFRLPMTLGLATALYTVVGGTIGLFVLSAIINALAPTFGARRNSTQAFKVAAYVVTPGCVASVFTLLPTLGTLLELIAALYAIYILYLGLVPVMQAPPERAAGYTATVIIVGIVASIVISIVLGTLGVFSHMAGFSPMGYTHAVSRQQEAATVGNAIGSLLGSDQQGKADLGNAIDNLAKAGEQMNPATGSAAGLNSVPVTTPVDVPATAAAPSSATAGIEDAQNAGAAIGGLIGALGGALNGGRRVEPVDFDTLKGLLPASLPDMRRIEANGESNQAMGMKGSHSRGIYTGANDARVQIEIADVSAVAGLMNIASAMQASTSSSSDTGYEKDVTVAGYPAHEKWDATSQHAELDFILAKRFTVGMSADHVDMRTLEADAANLPLSQLMAMKDAGAH